MKTKILTALVALVAIFTIVALIVAVINKDSGSDFTPPPFEASAVDGVPDEADAAKYGFASAYQPGMTYRTYLCGVPTFEDNKLIVYLTNPSSNNAWMKLRIYKGEEKPENIIAESGLIKPGQYVKYVTLNEGVDPASLTDGTNLKYKVMGYEPETYYSAGAFTVNTVIGGIAPETSEQPSAE